MSFNSDFNYKKMIIMEKKIIIVISILLSCVASYSQPKHYRGIDRKLDKVKTLDMANMRISYSLEFVPDSTESQKKWKDSKILLIGDKIQHFYSKYSRMQDSVATQAKQAYRPYSPPTGECAERYDIYYNYPEDKLTVIDNITIFQMHVFNEDLPITKLEWNITSETKTILNHLCYKASSNFRGRKWEAWFTMEIPINAGPWKLRGLPGLILKASDERNHYVFECTGIEKLKQPEPIIMYEAAYPAASNPKHTGTREYYYQSLREFHENYVNSLLSIGYSIRVFNDAGDIVEHIETTNPREKMSWGTTIHLRDRYRKIPYNPIELE